MKRLLTISFLLITTISFGQKNVLDDLNVFGKTTAKDTLIVEKAVKFSDGSTQTKAITDSGVEAFFLQPRGLFGTGGGFADEGFIGDVPVVLFSTTLTEKAIYTFYALKRVLLTDSNPVVAFVIYSTIVPVITTSDSVRWQLEARYIADTELATKTVDETILFTQGLSTFTANTRQSLLEFTLDKTLISDQDVLLFTLTRIGGDSSDIYGSDIAIGQSGIILITLNHNP